MHTPRIAIIGCGTVAQRYYAPALRAFPDIGNQVLLVDRDSRSAEELRKLIGAGEIHTDHGDVLEKAVGAVILVPHDLHHPVSMDFLRSGVPVMCEKPLALNPMDALEMIHTAEEAGTSLCMNNTRRMFPSFKAVKEMIGKRELGRLRKIVYREGSAFGWPSSTGFYVNPWLSSRGVLLDLGSHAIDTVCWWAGGKPVLTQYLDDSRGGPESVVRLVGEKDGCEVEVVLNRLCELNSFFRVEGERGRVEGKINDWRHLTVYDVHGRTRTLSFPSRERTYPAFILPILENFIRVVRGVEHPLVLGRDVLASVELIHECYENRKPLPCAWDSRPDRGLRVSGITEVKERKRVLVTGATGFIGCRVVEMIHDAGSEGIEAVAGLRQWSSAARLGRTPVPVAVVDLLDKGQVARALEGVTHVVHCAKGTPEATVQGTQNLLEACLASGVRQLVHMSTAEVYGRASGVVDERNPFDYTGNEYNRMKIDAEKACWEYYGKGLPVTIFRPSIVYGPFSAAWSLRFAAMFLAGEWGIYEGYGEGTCNLVYVDDLVKTVLGALDHPDAYGRAFNVNGPEAVSWNDYFTLLNRSMGLPPLKRVRKSKAGASTLVFGPVRTLGGFVKRNLLSPVKKAAEYSEIIDKAMRRVEHGVKVTPSREELELFSRKVKYSDSLARSILPVCPDTMIADGMGRTVEWLKYLGLLDGSDDGSSGACQESSRSRVLDCEADELENA